MIEKFDQFGSTLRQNYDGAEYLDLSKLDIRFLPATHPACLHFFRHDDGTIMSVAFVNRITRVSGLDGVERFFSRPGLHYLLYIQRSQGGTIGIRSHTFKDGSPEDRLSLIRPKTMSEWLSSWGSRSIDLSRFPHSCPRCGNAAYVGFNSIDCSQEGCV